MGWVLIVFSLPFHGFGPPFAASVRPVARPSGGEAKPWCGETRRPKRFRGAPGPRGAREGQPCSFFWTHGL